MLTRPFMIMISYSRADKVFVRNSLSPVLRAGGFIAYYDEDFLVGSNWKLQIEKAIKELDAFIFLASPESTNSPYCEWERELARRYNKPIIALIIRPGTNIPDDIKDIHYLDCSQEDLSNDSIASARLLQALYFQVL